MKVTIADEATGDSTTHTIDEGDELLQLVIATAFGGRAIEERAYAEDKRNLDERLARSPYARVMALLVHLDKVAGDELKRLSKGDAR